MSFEIRTLAQAGSGAITVPCPPNKKNRILSITATLSGTADGENIIIGYLRSTEFLARSSSPEIGAVTTRLSAFIGAAAIGAIAGAIYSPNALYCTMPLPAEAYWPFDVSVTFGVSGGANITDIVLTYEQSPM